MAGKEIHQKFFIWSKTLEMLKACTKIAADLMKSAALRMQNRQFSR
jgi:hypothetical protein